MENQTIKMPSTCGDVQEASVLIAHPNVPDGGVSSSGSVGTQSDVPGRTAVSGRPKSDDSSLGSAAPTETIGTETASCSMTKRSSSGSLLSPEIESTGQSDQESDDDRGVFYALKKESPHRMTVKEVLDNNEKKICDIWMQKILQNVQQTPIKVSHLELLVRGMREAISDRNRGPITSAHRTLRNELKLDSTMIDHFNLASRLFETAVNEVVPVESIIQHWIFSLNTLVKNAVQVTLILLSPKLNGCFRNEKPSYQPRCSKSEISSGTSRANSIGSQKNDVLIKCKCSKELQERMSSLEAEIMHFRTELMNFRKSLNLTLQHQIF